jgi:hypothetical protein
VPIEAGKAVDAIPNVVETIFGAACQAAPKIVSTTIGMACEGGVSLVLWDAMRRLVQFPSLAQR